MSSGGLEGFIIGCSCKERERERKGMETISEIDDLGLVCVHIYYFLYVMY